MDYSSEQIPKEFQIDTSDAKPIDAQTLRDHFEELTGMRGWLARSERGLYQCQTQLAELEQDSRKQLVNVLAMAVEFVDELRRLVADAKRGLGGDRGGSDNRGLFSKRNRGGDTGELKETQQWLETFQRVVASGINQLENHGVYHIPLLDEDLQELQFEGQPMKRWVSVKSRTDREQLVVTQEIQGLWVCKLDGQLFPVQRGEIIA